MDGWHLGNYLRAGPDEILAFLSLVYLCGWLNESVISSNNQTAIRVAKQATTLTTNAHAVGSLIPAYFRQPIISIHQAHI